jgi:7-cyano-7-deazaguanine reductase
MPQKNATAVSHDIKTPEEVSTKLLETISYLYHRKRDIEITIEQPEFTSVCPMTGLPDFGTLVIRYTPDSHIIELKSLKFYLLQFRNVGIFYEHLVNRVLDDLTKVLRPKRLEIEGNFTSRGGITTKAAVFYEDKSC